MTRELEEKHQHQDDEKWMKDRLLENIPEPEPVVGDLGLGHLGVQRHEGVEVILMEREQFLQRCGRMHTHMFERLRRTELRAR